MLVVENEQRPAHSSLGRVTVCGFAGVRLCPLQFDRDGVAAAKGDFARVVDHERVRMVARR